MRRTICRAVSSCLFTALFSINVAHAAMTILGQAGVSQSGSATYTTPIQVPPGTAGLEPKLSLSYNSHGGNGLLGIGWSMGGLSSIGRCAQTIAQDGPGMQGSVNFDVNDRYCLDGQRLIVISGTYGADNAEYRTERDGFSRIKSYSTAGNGPAWFKVWTKSGQIMEYGNTVDSRIEAQGKPTVRVWALNRVLDSKTNYYTVTYTEDSANGDFYPKRIDYTGNQAASTPTNNSVQFLYETKSSSSDIQLMYQGGSMVKNSVRLSKIQTYQGSNLVKEHRINYELGPTTLRSRIIKLTECTAANICLPPTSFSWTADVSSFDSTVDENNLNGFYKMPTQVRNDFGWFRHIIPLDINGDGKTDFVTVDMANVILNLVLSNGQGFNPPVLLSNLNAASFKKPGTVSTSGRPDSFFPMDVNGDGKTDLLVFDWTNSAWFTLYSNGNGFEPPVFEFLLNGFRGFDASIPMDINGDGRTDFVIVDLHTGTWYVILGTPNGFDAPYRLSNLDGFYNLISLYNGPLYNEVIKYKNFLPADVNGDGKMDLVVIDMFNGVWRTLISNGTGFNNPVIEPALNGWNQFLSSSNTPLSKMPLYRVIPMDLNNDGKTDLLAIDANRGLWRIIMSNGKGFNAPITEPNLSGFYALENIDPQKLRRFLNFFQMDVNGDGKMDLVVVDMENGRWRTLYSTGSGGFRTFVTEANLSGFYDLGDTNLTELYQNIIQVDINGDGKKDLLAADLNLGLWRMIKASNTSLPDQLISINNGLNAITSFNYRPLTDASVYTNDSDAYYPIRDFNLGSPRYVVSSIISSHASGDPLTTNYTYGGLKLDLSGRGLLGFRWIQAEQKQTNVITRTEFRQDWPYTGMPLTSKKTLVGSGNNGVLSQVTNWYGCADFVNVSSDCQPAINKRYFPFVKYQTQVGWDLNGAALPTTNTTFAYDNLNTSTQTWSDLSQIYGNLTQSIVNASDGYSTTTTNVYNNDTVNWFIGQLKHTTVTSTTP